MDWLLYLVAAVFFVAGAACVVLVALQLPGAWIMLALAAVIEVGDRLYLTDPAGWTFPLWLLLACAALAGVGELVEFLAAALGARQGGASRRGMIGALAGGVIGFFVFTPLFFFVPLIGALLGAVLGTFVGAIVGEMTGDRTTLAGTMKPALGATIGRVLGTASKVGVATVLWLVLSLAAFWP